MLVGLGRRRSLSLVVRRNHCAMSKLVKHSTFSAAVLAGLLGLTLLAGCWASARTKVEQMLSRAKLSPLPASASNVMYYQWNGLFTGETYAKFELSGSDLRLFLSNSPALQSIPPTLYDTNHQHIPFPSSSGDISTKHDYFYQHPKFPSWYDFTIRGSGRNYVIPWGPNMWILADEDRHIVWLRLIRG